MATLTNTMIRGITNRREGGLVGITFTIEGVPQFARVLGALMRNVKNLQPVWQDIKADFLAGEKKVFRQQGRVGDWGKWAPLNPVYAAYKRRKGWGTRILIRTGSERLMSSLTKESSPDFHFIGRPLGMEIGTRVPYARYHQTGTKHMPAREPVRLTNAQKRHWVKMIQLFLVESGQFERPAFGRRR